MYVVDRYIDNNKKYSHGRDEIRIYFTTGN